MKIIKNIEKVVDVPCISIPVHIYECTIEAFTPKQNRKLVSKHNWEDIGQGSARNEIADRGAVIVRFNKDTPDIVAHEMLHAVQFIMDRIGHKSDSDFDEPSAYLLDYLVREYYKGKKVLNNEPKKVNNKRNTKKG
jgi:hypothetical protein